MRFVLICSFFFFIAEECTPYFADDNPMSVIPPCVEFGGDLGEKLRGEQGCDVSHLEGDVEYEEIVKERSFAFSDDEDDSEFSDNGSPEKPRDDDEARRAAKFGRRLSKDGLFQRTHKTGEHLRAPIVESPDVGDLDEEVLSLPLTPPRPSTASVNTSMERLRTSTEMRSSTEKKKDYNATALEFPSDSPSSFTDTNPLLRQHSSDSENPLNEEEQCVSLEVTPRGNAKAQRSNGGVGSTRPISNPRNQRSQSMTSGPQASKKSTPTNSNNSKMSPVRPWVNSSPKNAVPNSHPFSAVSAGNQNQKIALRDRLRAITTDGGSLSPMKRSSSLSSPSPGTPGITIIINLIIEHSSQPINHLYSHRAYSNTLYLLRIIR